MPRNLPSATTTQSLGALLKSASDTMRKDRGNGFRQSTNHLHPASYAV